jgi:hypothetical protein
MAKVPKDRHSCSMKINEHRRKYSAELSISEEGALKKGIEENICEFAEKGRGLCAKACTYAP